MSAAVESRTVLAEQIAPLGDRLLVRRMKREERTIGGIILPEQSRDVSQMGVVVACGEKTTLRTDDVVIFSQYAATPCVAASDGGDELLFVREVDILAVVVFDGHAVDSDF